MKKRYKFLQKHMNEFTTTFNSLRGNIWSLNFPVFLYDRDWFRLKKVTLYDLAKHAEPREGEAPVREKDLGRALSVLAARPSCHQD